MPVRPISGAAALEAPPPLRQIGRPALDNQEAGAGGGSQVEEAVEVRSAGERRVEEDAEAEAELRGGEAENDVVGEIVEERGGDGGGDGGGAVLDVVFVD